VAASPERGTSWQGLLAIGDPHLESRQPGFRCDDYPHVVLNKLRWCLNYAIQHRLVPMLLGDLFDKPRDNPNWLITQLIAMMQSVEVIGIFGNHDCAETTLTEHDSLSILVESGCLQLVSEEHPWTAEMNGRPVLVGGSSYRQRIPERVRLTARQSLFEKEAFVVWLAHHDVTMAGYEEAGRFTPFEIGNVDLLVNGHIHRRLDTVRKGRTRWLTPGNISRRSRAEAIRQHVPSVLRIDVQPEGCRLDTIEVPHEPASRVFFEAISSLADEPLTSRFVDGLRELQLRRTDSGAGLHQFLEMNLGQFDEAVAREIRDLANEVTAAETNHA
jgi:DNA repair exonuclease SbcCD nuclease subunit